ncbi:MAG: 50S ribosomal protein L11 [Candidatus Wildermuthbacteria bacterium]|nr:50S ribosomal protein L11 [Candidatus Wildermuthbacteria bacterium]
MAKAIKKTVKLHIAAGQAKPGVNIGEFIKKFNEETKDRIGFKLPVDITIYEDRTFAFKTHQPQASALIKKAAGVEKGSGTPNKTKVGKITKGQLEEIAKQKMPDLNAEDLEAAKKIIAGTAKSLGIAVE